jgi:isoquinoline 1-oxidoreductase alpha subunit
MVTASTHTREDTVVKLQVNGQQHAFDGDPSMPLLWYLRDELGLTGTKFGCGMALCGACTVHVDGQATRACITAIGDINGRAVVTIEGLDPQGNHPVQRAWRTLNVPQCGYCQAGQIMQAAALLATSKNPSESEIASVMSGNICRCGCYQRITAAIKAAGTGA